MKVKYKNGEVSSVRNDLGRELVRAGIAEQLDMEDGSPALPKPGTFQCPEPEWEVVLRQKATGGAELAIRMRILGTDYFYSGRPEHANAVARWDGGQRFLSGMGRPIPPAVLEEYAARWKKHEELRAPSSITLNEYNEVALGAFMQAK